MPVHQKDGAGYRGDSYDFSGSTRSYDDYGRLDITYCRISKECVSPYMGRSLPRWEELGLDPDRTYYIYRPAEELARAAESFNSVPVTIEHPEQLDTPDTPQQRVGTTGSDTRFEAPYLVTSMKLLDKEAIEGVENGTRRELSIFPSFFELDMTPGDFMGQVYHGIARNIVGNSVALTIRGRIGAECAVGDSHDRKVTLMEGLNELIKEKFATASDSDVDELAQGILGLLKQQDKDAKGDESDKDEKAGEAKGDESDKKDKDDKGDEEDKDDKKDKEPMGDSAVKELVAKATADAVAQARQEHAATREAMRIVEPVFGHVSGDSADEIYKSVLNQEKIDITGVHPSAYKALACMAIKNKASGSTVTTGDSALVGRATAADFKDYF